MKTFINLLFVAILLPACSQSNDKAGANAPDTDIQTAVISGNLEAVEQHIQAGSDLNTKDPFSGSSPLITAATFGKIKIAEALIEGGADLSATNNDGASALHTAAFFCHVEIVQLLIDAKADKTLRNNFGATPRESVMGPFDQIKPIYEMLGKQLEPMGLSLDLAEIEKTRPVVAMMLQ